MQIYLLNKKVRTCNYLQRICKYIHQGLSDGFHVVSRGFGWFPLVILGYIWLSLVISGYPWLYLVIFGYIWLSLVISGYPWLYLVILGYIWLSLVISGYPWLYLVIYDSNIGEIVCAFAIIFPVIFRNFLQSRPDKMTMR